MGKIGADLSSVAVVGLDLAKHVFQMSPKRCGAKMFWSSSKAFPHIV